jgi:hypothetical protein
MQKPLNKLKKPKFVLYSIELAVNSKRGRDNGEKRQNQGRKGSENEIGALKGKKTEW